ncbi:MAG: FG-GAP repeat domain-containing protein [Planctomycetota bacterium]|jgi:hypothetical protein
MLLLLALAAPAAAPLSLAQDFDAPRLLHVETNQLVSGVADMNGDGNPDLVSHSYFLPASFQYQSSVLIQLGNGDGTFASTASSTDFPVLDQIASIEPVVLGDFDSDGARDVAFAVGTSGVQPFYYLLGNGDGTLQAPVADLDMFRRDNPPVLIEWDGDAGAEVAWVRRVPVNGVIELFAEILEWNGSGFSTIAVAANGLPQPDAAGVRSKLSVQDLNGDGLGELIVVDRQNQKARVYSNSGDSMAQLAAFDLNAVPDPNGGPLPLGDTGAIAGDFDGDGDQDLVTYHLRRLGFGFSTDPMGLRTTLIENQQSGPFTVHPAVDVTFDDQGISNFIVEGDLRALDWDQDGDDDIAGPIGNLGQFVFSLGSGSSPDSFATEVHLFENLGGATFASPGRRVNPGQVALAGVLDVDGDGAEDLVTHARILLNDGNFDDGPQFEQVPSSTTIISKADFEGDGDMDYLWVNGSLFSDLGTMFLNDGTGSFQGIANSFVQGLPSSSFVSRIAQGDFDGDGKLEITGTITTFDDLLFGQFFDTGQALLELGEGGVWSVVSDQTLSAYPEAVRPLAVDVDDDGDLDLVDGTLFYPNDGTGVFGPPVPSFVDEAVKAGADVDADGDLDYVTIKSVAGDDTVALRISNPSGDELIELGQQATPVISPFGSVIPDGQWLFRDADGDGDLDVLATLFPGADHGHQVTILENLGSTFAAPVTVDVPGDLDSFGDLAIADSNGDGVLDLVVLMRASVALLGSWSNTVVFHGTGNGLTYEPAVRYLVTNNFGLVDGDSDGDLDVLGAYGVTEGLGALDAGSLRQFGSGSLGTGDLSPLLGASGPLSVGSPDAAARLVRGVGGAPAWIAVGDTEVELLDAPLPGLTLYVDGLSDLLPVILGGTPGVAGEGELVIPLPIGPELAGLSVYAEAFLVDAASPSLIAHSNGLELNFGQ